ncbi:MAG: LacI family DNA-binding transcriptional regulator [Melioribacteraceae bacterium]|nr:LacI family DNA-binding transcriptional regulator [Melioribacteraceae bacterium]
MSKERSLKKYEILRNELLSYINKHGLKTNDRLPTIKEIIKDSNFSYATVNRTLIEMENEGIISKHQGKGLYVNRVKASNILRQVSLIIPAHFSDHKIFMNILSGVRRTLESANIGLLVSISNMSHQKEKETIEMLISKSIDGIILFMEDGYLYDYSHIKELKSKNFPFVLVDRFIPELETDFVVVNNHSAMIRIYSYLKYNKGCNKIYFVKSDESPDNISSTQDKFEGIKDANKLLFGEDINRIISLEELVSNLEKISASDEKVGISFNHDAMITKFLQNLEEQNLVLPENLHLFGYNNSGRLEYPTVEQFNEKVGEKAAELLINKLNSAEILESSQIKIEPKLIIPEETGNLVMEK